MYTNNTVTSTPIVDFHRPAIAEHFRTLHRLAAVSGHKGNLVLAAFGEGLAAKTLHFEIGDHVGMTAAAMTFQGTGYNIYAPLGIYRADLEENKKGRESDLVALLGAVIDGDADKGRAAPVPPVEANYVLETSPGNLQHFLFFDRALIPPYAKAFCKALKRATKGDSADDISHVWRIGGGVNYPNAAKIARGRSTEPFLVKVTKPYDEKLTDMGELHTILQPYWREAQVERTATVAAGQNKHDLDPAKVEAFLVRLRGAGYFDAGEDARMRYIHAAKACSHDLGEEVGRPIWERVVCWSGERADEGETVTADEAEERWKDCSSLRTGVRPLTFGSLIDDSKRLYGWSGTFLKRGRTAAEMFDGVAQIAAAAGASSPPQLPPLPYEDVQSPPLAPGVSLMSGGDPATVWKSVDKFNNPQAGDWANTETLLRRLKYEVRFNAWTERSEIREVGGEWIARQDWHVDKLARIGSSHPHNYRPAESTFRRALDSMARDNTVDPARNLLDKLQANWDGQERLHSWLSHACGVPYDAYHQSVGQCILLGLVARMRVPGVKFDLMPVFVSEVQGTSKSTLARMLALVDDWFTESVHLGDEEKELVLLLAGKCVAEISEMRTKGQVDAVKAMISATHDEGRPAYGRSIVKRPRRNIFVGTTNRTEFLEDPTGARRFLPIVVQSAINLEFVQTHIAQLVGEAAALQSRGVDINMPPELWATAAEHQEAATSQSATEVVLSDWFGGDAPCWISPANLVLLLRQALGREISKNVYGPVMKKLGFASRAVRVGTHNEPIRRWMRGEPKPETPGYGPQLSPSGRPAVQRPFPVP